MIGALAAALVLLAPDARAHGLAPPGVDAGALAFAPDPLVTTLLLVAAVAYAAGLSRLRARAGRTAARLDAATAAAFAGGWALLALALVWPLDGLAGMALSAHMIQHVILIAAAPPLLLAGRPEVAFVWAMPRRARRATARSSLFRAMRGVAQALNRPTLAAAAHGAAMWIWHAPALFDAAIADETLHTLEHVTFVATALWFWHAVMSARAPVVVGSALVGTLIAMIMSGFLGALLSFAPVPLYAAYNRGLFGFDVVEDQQLAGLIMWVPAGLSYLAAALRLGTILLSAGARATGTPPLR